MSWRQVDCESLPSSFLPSFYLLDGWWLMTQGHINNLYNTTFWSMVLKGGMGNTEAERELQVSFYQFNSVR